MKRNWWVLTIIVIGSILLPQIGCEEQAKKPAASPQTPPAVASAKHGVSATPKITAAPAKAEPNNPLPAAPADEGPAPKITFESEVHDFGDIGPGSSNACEFKFTNTGIAVLKVNKKIESTCGCTVPELSKEEYAPGESGIIKVKFSAGKQASPVSKHMYVSSNDKTRTKIDLTIKANIILKVDYEPKQISLSLKQENAGCPQITIRSLDGQPFAIRSFSSTADALTIDVNSAVTDTNFVIKPTANLDKLKNSIEGTINIGLTHPQCDSITIPFNVLARFEFNPKTLVILKAKPQQPITRKVWLLNNYNEDFEIESTASEKGAIKVLTQQKVGPRYEFELEITPPPAQNGIKFFTDILTVNIKNGEKQTITCRGFYSKN
jgi:hypothetical protein